MAALGYDEPVFFICLSFPGYSCPATGAAWMAFTGVFISRVATRFGTDDFWTGAQDQRGSNPNNWLGGAIPGLEITLSSIANFQTNQCR